MFEDATKQRLPLAPLRITCGRDWHRHGQHALGLIAEVLPGEFQHCCGGQRGAGKQHQRKRYFGNDKNVAQAVARAA